MLVETKLSGFFTPEQFKVRLLKFKFLVYMTLGKSLSAQSIAWCLADTHRELLSVSLFSFAILTYVGGSL